MEKRSLGSRALRADRNPLYSKKEEAAIKDIQNASYVLFEGGPEERIGDTCRVGIDGEGHIIVRHVDELGSLTPGKARAVAAGINRAYLAKYEADVALTSRRLKTRRRYVVVAVL